MARFAARSATRGTVWTSFRQWRDDGTLDRLHEEFRDRERAAVGRDFQPGADCLDGQSVKATEKAARAFDVGKKVSGRKRYPVVDTLGRIHGLAVLPANVQDRDGANCSSLPSSARCLGSSGSGPTTAMLASWRAGSPSTAGRWKSWPKTRPPLAFRSWPRGKSSSERLLGWGSAVA